MKKRIISMMLSLCMVCTLIMTACAAQEVPAQSGGSTSAPESLRVATPFSDVPVDVWYAPAVNYCREQGLMTGISDTLFDPNGSVTRAMVATILYRAEEQPTPVAGSAFTDVSEDSWYADAVAWAEAKGFVQGYGDGRFGPDDPVTHEQLAIIFQRYGGDNTAGMIPSDSKEIATRADTAVALYALFTGVQLVPDDESRILVAYFSATGTTKSIAESIKSITGGELFEIIPEIPYTAADLNYSDSSCRANQEQQDNNARPAIAADCVVEDMDSYDVVFLGYPIWWGIPPKIMQTFVESYDLSGKIIIPFCTSGGSAFSASGLTELTPNAVWVAGKCLNGESQDSIAEWISGMNLDSNDEVENVSTINVSVGNSTFTAVLEKNEAVTSFVKLMQKNPVTIQMSDYAGFEKVGTLGTSLPTSNSQTTTQPGDIVLYQGNQIVIFYGSNSWSYTRLGHIADLTGWEDALGSGDITVTFSLGG